MEILAFLRIDLSINKERCEMLTAVLLIGYIVSYSMIAHLFERIHSILGFAKRHLVGGNYPIIEGQLAMVVHEIVAVDQEI